VNSPSIIPPGWQNVPWLDTEEGNPAGLDQTPQVREIHPTTFRSTVAVGARRPTCSPAVHIIASASNMFFSESGSILPSIGVARRCQYQPALRDGESARSHHGESDAVVLLVHPEQGQLKADGHRSRPAEPHCRYSYGKRDVEIGILHVQVNLQPKREPGNGTGSALSVRTSLQNPLTGRHSRRYRARQPMLRPRIGLVSICQVRLQKRPTIRQTAGRHRETQHGVARDHRLNGSTVSRILQASSDRQCRKPVPVTRSRFRWRSPAR